MRDYGKVHSAIWSSPDFLSYSDDAKLLVFYLLTSTHTTMTGAFRLPDGYLCADLGWPSERVNKGLRELFQKGFCNRCETTNWVLISKFLRWNPPENPNQWIAVGKHVSQIPEQCSWKPDFMRFLAKSFADSYPQKENPFGTVAKPFRNQEQEQEQEQYQKQEKEQEQELLLGAEDEPEPVHMITIPLVDKTNYPISETQIEEWKIAFPAIDVMQELHKVKQWNVANPRNRKTKAGILRHLTSWLSKAQDRAPAQGQHKGPISRAEANARYKDEQFEEWERRYGTQ